MNDRTGFMVERIEALERELEAVRLDLALVREVLVTRGLMGDGDNDKDRG